MTLVAFNTAVLMPLNAAVLGAYIMWVMQGNAVDNTALLAIILNASAVVVIGARAAIALSTYPTSKGLEWESISISKKQKD